MPDLIDRIIAREGGEQATNDPRDVGGRTTLGISEAANPEAWADGQVTREEARAIYQRKYIDGPGFGQLPTGQIQEFLIDWGVTSGPSLAITKLQVILGVTQDGKLGPASVSAVRAFDQHALLDRLIDERIMSLARIVVKRNDQLAFLLGWLKRAISFRYA